MTAPMGELTHLAHVELLTPKPLESRAVWTQEERKKGKAWGPQTVPS